MKIGEVNYKNELNGEHILLLSKKESQLFIEVFEYYCEHNKRKKKVKEVFDELVNMGCY